MEDLNTKETLPPTSHQWNTCSFGIQFKLPTTQPKISVTKVAYNLPLKIQLFILIRKIEFSLNVFTEYHFKKRITVLETTPSCVRDRDSTTVSLCHTADREGS